ncbi:MAG: hypothetical protein ACRC9F_01525 [Metamycoplasmataceae bacterium]
MVIKLTKNKHVIAKIILPTKNRSISPIFVPGRNGCIIKLLKRVINPYFQPVMKKDIAIKEIARSNLKKEAPKTKGMTFEMVVLINESDNINAENTNEKNIDLFLENIIINP